ncbi:hypothetical protein MIR68_009783 [Amoeboaphelidium protococcarum]|nr:hypothetical protein MIR68_009783 [Amoeboaphelidium protococcarum]
MLQQRQKQQKIIVDTFKLVTNLERNGLSKSQSVRAVNVLLNMADDEASNIRQQLVTKQQTDHDFVAYKVRLHELKSELASLRKTETAALQQQTSSIQKDLDLLTLKWKEDFNTVKSDLQLDMNTRKSEMKQETQKNEIRIQDILHRVQLNAGDLKTSLEAMKLELLTKWSAGIVLGVAASLVFALKVWH